MKISVVIPTFNVEPYIAQALDSALTQTRPAHEVIVADDCSTDGTREVVRRYPVRLIELERNGGHAVARNRAIAAASGDVIAMLDGDDYWAPHHLATLGEMLERHPQAVLAASAARVFGVRDHVLFPHFLPGEPLDVFDIAFEKCVVWHMTVLYRRDVVQRIGGYYEPDSICSDMDLWMRLSREGPFVCTHGVTAFYRAHMSQISAVPYRQSLAEFRHRRRFVDRIGAGGDTVLAETLAGRLTDIWRRVVREAWQSRDATFMRRLLDIRDVIPGAGVRDEIVWGTASRLVPFARVTWDRLPVPIRRRMRRHVA